MTTLSASALATQLNRRIARRLRVARWGKTLWLPTLGATFYFFHVHEWLFLGGFGLFALEVIAIMAGEIQRCPLCEASLVIRHRWDEEFAATCPECGYVID